ncbi:uncharacterized protein LOC121995028 [Zingiber officinale]|uniref:uncharacterized protein LOC121995028 n=1 Tax=Zingiber officinale TaxID=94328 RepID=UPI001C4D56A8|nr:uncharacterized protein LOC121995028 [Zingiber officinale]
MQVEGFAAVGAENIDALEGVDVAALVNPKEGWDTADVGVAKEKPVAKVDVVVTGEDEVVLPDDTASNELGAKELPLPKEKGEVEMLVMAGEEVAVAEEENRGDAEEEAGNGDTKDGAGADVVGTEKAGGDEDVANEGTEETGVVEAEDGADGEKRLEVVEAEDGADGGKRLKVEAAEDGADVEKRLEVEKAEDAADEEPKVERPKRDGEEPAEEEAPREKPVAEDEAAPAAVGAKEKGEAEEREKEEEAEETEELNGETKNSCFPCISQESALENNISRLPVQSLIDCVDDFANLGRYNWCKAVYDYISPQLAAIGPMLSLRPKPEGLSGYQRVRTSPAGEGNSEPLPEQFPEEAAYAQEIPHPVPAQAVEALDKPDQVTEQITLEDIQDEEACNNCQAKDADISRLKSMVEGKDQIIAQMDATDLCRDVEETCGTLRQYGLKLNLGKCLFGAKVPGLYGV